MALGAFRNKNGVLENEKGAVEEREREREIRDQLRFLHLLKQSHL